VNWAVGANFLRSFLRSDKICCKTAQFWDAHCKLDLLGGPIKKHAAQRCEKLRNSLGLNYKSVALVPELG